MTRLFLVRHGQTDWNNSKMFQGHQDTELSDLGIRQADCLAERLASEKIDAAYASDLQRAYRTATIALKHHQIHVVPDLRLREMFFGAFEGMTAAQFVARYPEEWQRWNDDWVDVSPVGSSDTLKHLTERVEKFFNEVKLAHPDETVLVVGHSGTLRAFLCLTLHIDLKYFWQQRLDNTSITIIDTYGERNIVSLVNDTCHLKDL
ncbi:MAG: histidine phosphatase family protein [Dehalococcoidia bacterium]|nr:histidine phosphatase family protein [Dehalococcoidia bacterium]